MPNDYFFSPDLFAQVEFSDAKVARKPLYDDERSKIVLLGFQAGQEITAHTAPFAATLHFVKGEATVQLGSDTLEAKAGTLAYMPPQLEHAIKAKTEVIMLLTVFKK